MLRSTTSAVLQSLLPVANKGINVVIMIVLEVERQFRHRRRHRHKAVQWLKQFCLYSVSLQYKQHTDNLLWKNVVMIGYGHSFVHSRLARMVSAICDLTE